MSTLKKGVLAAAIWASSASSVPAGTAFLTFEGLQNFEEVLNYYNGGSGGLGTGPGPGFGITFSSDALAYIPGLQTGAITPFPDDPSPPTVLLLFTPPSRFVGGYPTPLSIDVAAGFTQSFTFYDDVIGRPASVAIYSGLDGTGMILAQESLPITFGVFTPAMTLTFSGTARSVVFEGGNDQLLLDNLFFASTVPEPSSWISLVLGLGCSYLWFAPRWRKRLRGQTFEGRKSPRCHEQLSLAQARRKNTAG